MEIGKSLKEIDDELPNGFHDAFLETIALNFAASIATLTLQLLVGVPDGASEEERESYRRATLTLEGLVYFVIDAPDSERRFSRPEGVMIDAGDALDRSNPRAPAPPSAAPAGAFAYWFFVHEWNAFIHIAAQSAVLEWDHSH